jgi:2-oxoglutarate dehydrogenase E1 component
VEELVPFPHEEVRRVASQYAAAVTWVWCNEEHENQGAWHYVYPRFFSAAGVQLRYAGREASATPAVGYSAAHKAEVAAYFSACFE